MEISLMFLVGKMKIKKDFFIKKGILKMQIIILFQIINLNLEVTKVI